MTFDDWRFAGKRGVVAAFGVALVAVPAHGAAQTDVPEVRLGEPSAELSVAFSNVVSIVEIPDGRIIVADRREGRLVVADFSSDAVTMIGRIGQGPGEYTSVSRIFRLEADTILMVDVQQGRGLMLVGDQIVRTTPPAALSNAAGGGAIIGADTLGFLLARTQGAFGSDLPLAPAAWSDSAGLIVSRRSSGLADTVARLGPRSSEMVVNGRAFSFRVPAIAAEEEAIHFPDGWTAIVRLDPYRVDWRSPREDWTYGPPLPLEETEVDDREKRSFLAYLAAIGRRAPPDDSAWPETVPPIHHSGLYSVAVASPDGRLLVKRTPTADDFVSRYDVVDRRGALVGRVVLEVNQRIAAFGPSGVYVISTDEVGLEHVRRYPGLRIP